jgi:nitrogen regulatory protein P-II 1
MRRVVAIIRPHKLDEVKTAIANLGVSGLTVNDVRGSGSSPERPALFGGSEVLIALPVKAKLTVVVPDDLVEAVVAAVLEHARTGEPGDGKLFVEPVVEAIRVRTGERGEAGL